MSSKLERFYHPKSEGRIYLNTEDVVPHIKIEDRENVPYIFGWAGPGRCGSTALLLLLTGNLELIDRGFYQPQKTIIRNGEPDCVIPKRNPLAPYICFKEVFGPRADQEYYNPAEILYKAGVPIKNMTFIMMLRNPVNSFASWYVFTGDDSNPQLFAKAQQHTIDLYYMYREQGLRVVPFVYELLSFGEERILRRLLQIAGLGVNSLSLDFNLKSLGINESGDYDPLNETSKMVWGEALYKDHWDAVVKPIARRGKYHYEEGSEKVDLLPEDLKIEVTKLCRDGYNNFLNLSITELGLKELKSDPRYPNMFMRF